MFSLSPAGATAATEGPESNGSPTDASAEHSTTTEESVSGVAPEPMTLGRVETAVGSAFIAAANPIPADEASFVSMINQLRSSHGLNSLAVHSELTGQARQWTQVMIDADRLHHASDLSVGIRGPGGSQS